jgi:uncharacterized protein (TIGR02145 family)
MKTKLLLSALLSFVFSLLSSQVPQGFNYQAIARDGSGNILANQALPVKIDLQTSLTGGILIYEETFASITSNQFGLISLVVGTGTQTGGSAASFSAIDWKTQTLFLQTIIQYPGTSWTSMGTSQIWGVPYSQVAKDVEGPLKKLGITGTTDNMEEALFEVKNKAGNIVFAVYNEGVRVYVGNGDAKGVRGGFSVGGYDATKGVHDLLTVTSDSVRVYVDNNPATKGVRGGFSVGGYDMTKSGTLQNYLDVSGDSVRIYVDNANTKGKKGGFAVGGYDMTKDASDEYLRVTSDSVKVSKSLLIPRLTTYERDNLPFMPGEALIIFNMTEGCMQIFKNNVWSNIWCFNCAPDFIIQPVSNIICSGNNVTFFVSATGTNLSYQWQQSTDNGSTWNNISNGGSNPAYSGAKSHTITISNIPVGYNNYKYRCTVSGSCLPNITSDAVTLNVGSTPPVITSQPTDQQLSTGCVANFSITSPGYSVSYKWQQSDDGGISWTNISNGGTSPVYSGVTASTLSLSNVPSAYNSYKYHCIVRNLCGPDVTSNAATLSAISMGITVQPVNKSVYAGQNISFNITTSGVSRNYQWQESTDGGSTWLNITDGGSSPSYTGAITANLNLSNVPIAYDTYKYHCIVSDYCHFNSISNTAMLSVLTASPVTDIDNNTYNTVGIGSQLWMAENLKTTKYKDGTDIPLVTDDVVWGSLTTPGYCWFNNNEAIFKDTYGGLYNWYAVNTGKLCPTGWHAPTDAEWTILTTYLGGESVAGGKLKETGTAHWQSPNFGATNESGFTALAGGFRAMGSFGSFAMYGHWWSSTSSSADYAYYRRLYYADKVAERVNFSKYYGYSIRCVKD